MRKFLPIALAVAAISAPAMALEPWPTVVDRDVIAKFRLQSGYDRRSAELGNDAVDDFCDVRNARDALAVARRGPERA